MNQRYMAIALGGLLAGCEGTSPSIVGPRTPEAQPDTSTDTVSGRVQDIEGAAIPAAVVTLENQSPVRTAQSDESGQFRFEGVRGLVVMRATKADLRKRCCRSLSPPIRCWQSRCRSPVR